MEKESKTQINPDVGKIERENKPINLKLLKAELFTYGIRFNDADFETLRLQNPYNENRSGLSAGRFVILNDETFVNLPFWEPFVKYSPFRFEGGVLFKNGERVDMSLKFAPTPKWVTEKLSSGKYAGQIIQPHGKANLATMAFGCELQTRETKCRFCTAPFYNQGSERNLADILESLDLALKENPNYSLSINAGTLLSDGRGLEIIVPYVRAIRERYPTLGIMVEIAPPKDPKWLERLREANNGGELGIMFNLNFWSEAALNIVEPGKNKLIPKEEYIEIWRKALEIFGQGNISSCILCGIEAEEYTRQAIDYLTDMGIIPEIIMFRPTIGSDLNKVPLDPELFYRLSEYARQRMLEREILPAQVGCVNCGGCSLTTMINRQELRNNR